VTVSDCGFSKLRTDVSGIYFSYPAVRSGK